MKLCDINDNVDPFRASGRNLHFLHTEKFKSKIPTIFTMNPHEILKCTKFSLTRDPENGGEMVSMN